MRIGIHPPTFPLPAPRGSCPCPEKADAEGGGRGRERALSGTMPMSEGGLAADSKECQNDLYVAGRSESFAVERPAVEGRVVGPGLFATESLSILPISLNLSKSFQSLSIISIPLIPSDPSQCFQSLSVPRNPPQRSDVPARAGRRLWRSRRLRDTTPGCETTLF